MDPHVLFGTNLMPVAPPDATLPLIQLRTGTGSTPACVSLRLVWVFCWSRNKNNLLLAAPLFKKWSPQRVALHVWKEK